MAHKTCVARRSCSILIWSPYLTRPWPLLSIRSILICYLLHPLGSLLAKFGLAAVISPVPVADEAKSDDCDLWSDLDLTCELLIFFNYLKSTHWELPIAVSLRLLVRQLGGGGGRICLPPPQWGAFGQMPQWGASSKEVTRPAWHQRRSVWTRPSLYPLPGPFSDYHRSPQLFSKERKLYTRELLERHLREGDAGDDAHSGHPLCHLCQLRSVAGTRVPGRVGWGLGLEWFRCR